MGRLVSTSNSDEWSTLLAPKAALPCSVLDPSRPFIQVSWPRPASLIWTEAELMRYPSSYPISHRDCYFSPGLQSSREPAAHKWFCILKIMLQ